MAYRLQRGLGDNPFSAQPTHLIWSNASGGFSTGTGGTPAACFDGAVNQYYQIPGNQICPGASQPFWTNDGGLPLGSSFSPLPATIPTTPIQQPPANINTSGPVQILPAVIPTGGFNPSAAPAQQAIQQQAQPLPGYGYLPSGSYLQPSNANSSEATSSTDIFGSALSWIEQNPLIAAAIGIGVIFLLGGRR